MVENKSSEIAGVRICLTIPFFSLSYLYDSLGGIAGKTKELNKLNR